MTLFNLILSYLLTFKLFRVFFQVLSESVSKALTLTAGSEVQETACFVLMFDKIF